MLKTIVIGMIIGIVIAYLVGCSGKGIVILEGYEHGVSFCEKDFPAMLPVGDPHTWNDGVATYVINKGHYNDPEVKELVKLTHEICAK